VDAVIPAVPICVALLITATAPPPAHPAPAGETPVPETLPACARCHTCPEPTSLAPCLSACPRHAGSASLPASLGPDVVILDELEDLYVPVRFDHRTHAVMAGMSDGCNVCHHYAPPNAPHPACRSCHPRGDDREDLAKPGLKGAYHRRCLGCHREWDRTAACEACHLKRKGGRLGGTATGPCDHAPVTAVELKELILFPTSFAPGDVVPFHHTRHSRTYEQDCTACHRQQRCTRCHLHGPDEPHPMREGQASDLHDTCFACHDGNRCSTCHGRSPTAMFSHADTGWPLKPYHASLPCRSCHRHAGPFHALDPRCPSCHAPGFDPARFDHAVTGVTLNDVHREAECGACHAEGLGSKAHCDACHDDGRAYDPANGFKTGPT
jgi:hypothetical protein